MQGCSANEKGMGMPFPRVAGPRHPWIHVMYNIVFTATDVASKVSAFSKEIFLKYQVMAQQLNEVIRVKVIK